MNGRHRIVWLALAWAASAPLLAASEETPAGPKIDFRYGYYPSHHKLRFLAVSPPADKTDWQVVLTAQGSAAALAQQSGRLPFRKSGKTIDVPDLPEGSYELTLTLTGAGQPVQVNRTFTRNRFPWENNTLGKDPVVVPPFTPLTVDESGPAVQCILRRHVVSPAGLWQRRSAASDTSPPARGPSSRKRRTPRSPARLRGQPVLCVASPGSTTTMTGS
jgi:hypothetical protein